jgi:hypothetical protein
VGVDQEEAIEVRGHLPRLQDEDHEETPRGRLLLVGVPQEGGKE